jgi:starvation-inducible DNA-binding protein
MARKSKSSVPADRVNIGLSPAVRSKVAAILNGLLADAFVLYVRARDFHWNVTGRTFAQDHLLFETEYEALDETIDAIAERARALGGRALAGVAVFSKRARLPEVDSSSMGAEAMIGSLLDGHEAIIRQLREDVETVDDLDDEGTADFLTGLMEGHEKRAWMLRSHLDPSSIRSAQ